MVSAEKCAGCGMDVTPGNAVSVKVYGDEDISERWHLRCYHMTADTTWCKRDATTGEDWPMTAEGVAEHYEWVRRTYPALKR